MVVYSTTKLENNKIHIIIHANDVTLAVQITSLIVYFTNIFKRLFSLDFRLSYSDLLVQGLIIAIDHVFNSTKSNKFVIMGNLLCIKLNSILMTGEL